MKIQSETILNIALVFMCLTVTGVAFDRYIIGRFWPPQPAPGPTEYRPGQQLAGQLNELIDRNARVNVVLVVSQNCKFCLASVDLYRRLAALPAVQQGRMRITFIGFNFEDAKAFVTKNQFAGGRPPADP
jgi:hypothetical protein